MFHFQTGYLNDPGFVQLGHYHDGSIAIRLVSAYGEPLLTPTQCLSAYGETPAEGHVFIRDDAEFVGMLQSLQDQGILGPPVRTLPCGYTTAYECELLVTVDDEGVRSL